MNADLVGVQHCSHIIITYEKQGTILDKKIVFVCLWQELILVKVVVKSKVPGYGITLSTWLTNICTRKTLERLSQNILSKHINKFIKFYNVPCACILCYCDDYIFMCSMPYHKQILDWLVLNHSYFECNVLDTFGEKYISSSTLLPYRCIIVKIAVELVEPQSFSGNRQRNTFVKLLKCCVYGM